MNLFFVPGIDLPIKNFTFCLFFPIPIKPLVLLLRFTHLHVNLAQFPSIFTESARTIICPYIYFPPGNVNGSVHIYISWPRISPIVVCVSPTSCSSCPPSFMIITSFIYWCFSKWYGSWIGYSKSRFSLIVIFSVSLVLTKV